MSENPIRARRIALGLSQAELAREVGLDRQQMWKIETNRRAVKLEEAPAFERVLGLDLEQITGQKPLESGPEGEARFVAEPDMSEQELRLARLLYPQGQTDMLIVTSPSLLLAGYVPGDRILVDREREPEEKDCVVCQLYDEETGWGPPLLRCYEPPFLIPHSVEGHYRFFEESTHEIRILGVIVSRYQQRSVPCAA